MKSTNNTMELQEKHDGGTARNARIRIDYQGLKPKVQFSYPSLKDQVVGNMLYTIRSQFLYGYLLAWFLLLLLYPNSNAGQYELMRNEYLWLIGGAAVWFYVLGPIVYFLNRKGWNKMYPAHQARTSKKKVALFYPKDVKYDSELGYYCEIPVFSNIVCNYEATGEFSKHLSLFEIQEHKFQYYRENKKHSVNEWLWYARFYLKEKPTTGTLEVIFK